MADDKEEMVVNVTAKSIFQEAENEIRKEKIADAKRKVKEKLRELSRAQKIVANLRREIDELQLEITHDLES